MRWYLIRLQLRSWFTTPWFADTIFGHLCWAMRHLYGEKALGGFLQRYQEGAPPLLLSNGFPEGYLPCPIVSLPPLETTAPLDVQQQQFELQRKRRALHFLTLQQFNQFITLGEPGFAFPATEERLSIARVTLKNQLSRITGTTGAEGTLYTFDEYYCSEIVVYVKVADDFIDTCQQLFEHLARVGYGKRKSAGYGQVAKVGFEQFDGFAPPSDANGFVTLSNFVPAAHDPRRGNWHIIVKYGRMGEERATGGQAFKKPLVMLVAGSTFYDSPCRSYYGRLVRGLNPAYPDTVQYGLALPVPVKLPELGGR